MKKWKLFLGLVVLVLIIRTLTGNIEPTSKTIEEIKKDSLELVEYNKKQKIEEAERVRAQKISYALTTLKEMVKSQMKDPDSFKMLQRIYDEKAKGDVIGLIIEYSGTNSFGGRIKNVAYGKYNIKKDKVWVTDKP